VSSDQQNCAVNGPARKRRAHLPGTVGRYLGAFLCASAVFPCAFTAVQAADYRTEARVRAGANYDSNRRLGGAQGEVTKFVLSPRWTNRWTDERMVLDLDANADIIQSEDDDVENDRVDFGTSLDLEYRFPTSILDFGLSADRRSLLDAQFADAGVADVDGRQLSYGGNAGWSKQLSESIRLIIQANIQNQQFNVPDSTANNIFGLFQDNLSYGANIGIDRNLSRRLTVGVFVSGQRQEVDNPFFGNTNTGSAYVSTNYQASQYVELSGQVGLVHVDNNFVQTTSWTASGDVNYNFERWSARVNLNRNFQPSANGTSRRALGTSFTGGYEFSSRLKVDATASFRRSLLLGLQQRNDRQIGAGASLDWRFATNLSLRARYNFRNQELAGNDPQSAHIVGLSLEAFYPPQGLGD